MLTPKGLSLLCTPLLIAVGAEVAQAAEFDALSSSLRMLWGLLIVLTIMFVLYAILRKKVSALQQPGKGIIRIVEIKHLPPRKSLILIEVRGREYLVGAGNDAINTIVPLLPGTSFSSMLEASAEKRQP